MSYSKLIFSGLRKLKGLHIILRIEGYEFFYIPHFKRLYIIENDTYIRIYPGQVYKTKKLRESIVMQNDPLSYQLNLNVSGKRHTFGEIKNRKDSYIFIFACLLVLPLFPLILKYFDKIDFYFIGLPVVTTYVLLNLFYHILILFGYNHKTKKIFLLFLMILSTLALVIQLKLLL